MHVVGAFDEFSLLKDEDDSHRLHDQILQIRSSPYCTNNIDE